MAHSRIVTSKNVRYALAGAIPLALSITACSALLQTADTQCTTNSDCTARGPAFASTSCVNHACTARDAGTDASSPLSCLGSVKAPPTPPAGTISVTMSFYNEVSPSTNIANVSVTACEKLDVNCESSLGAAVASDSAGNATLSLPAGFDGYLEMNGPGMVPSLWYFSPAPTEDARFAVGLLTPSSFQQIASSVGATLDPDAGHAFNFALDCTDTYGTFVSGMSFSSSQTTDETRPFYFINGLPSTTATTTDTSGIGGFANLPTGAVTITAEVASSSQRSGSVSVLVRAGTITYSPIAPSP